MSTGGRGSRNSWCLVQNCLKPKFPLSTGGRGREGRGSLTMWDIWWELRVNYRILTRKFSTLSEWVHRKECQLQYHIKHCVNNYSVGPVCLFVCLSIYGCVCLCVCACVFVCLFVSVCLFICLSVQATTFEQLKLQTSRWVNRYILTILKSSMSIKVILSRSRSNFHSTYLFFIKACLNNEVIWISRSGFLMSRER